MVKKGAVFFKIVGTIFLSKLRLFPQSFFRVQRRWPYRLTVPDRTSSPAARSSFPRLFQHLLALYQDRTDPRLIGYWQYFMLVWKVRQASSVDIFYSQPPLA